MSSSFAKGRKVPVKEAALARKRSQASKARLLSSKHTGTKQNLTQNGHSRSFKVTCFGVSEKAIRY